MVEKDSQKAGPGWRGSFRGLSGRYSKLGAGS